MKQFFFAFIFLLCAFAGRSQTTYYWVGGTAEGNISSAANWNTKQDGSGTTRAVSAATDILIIDGANIGGATSATGIATINVNSGTTAQVKIVNGASVTMVRTATTGTLTLANNTPGQDGLTIDATSILQLGSATSGYTGAVFLDLPTSTASIAGKIKFLQATTTGASSRMTCRTVGGVVFTTGSSFEFDNTLGYPFGTVASGTPGTSNSLNYAVVFQSGTSLINTSLYSPFGSSSTSWIVDFRSGSNYYVRNTMTTGSLTNAKTFANVFIQNNATLTTDGAALNKIENLTIDAGCNLNVGASTSTQIPVLGNLTVNGAINGTLSPGTTILVMGGNSAQSISGTGAINVSNFIIGDNSSVTLNSDISVAIAINVYGKLNLTNHKIAGTGTFTSRVNFTPSTGATQTGAGLTTGSFLVTVASGLSSLQGLSVAGTGIPAGTNIVSYSSSGGQLTLSQPATVTNSNVTLTFSSNTATLTTAHPNGFDSTAGAIVVTGTKTYQAGTNYIINAATNTPVGITSGTASAMSVGNLTLNANATTNTDIKIGGVLALNNSIFSIRTIDTLRISGGSLAGSFGTGNYIATLADNTTGNKGVLVYQNITASTLLPIGSSNNYLPVTLNPSATGGGDYSVNVFEGITANALPNGTALTDKTKTVNAVWNINRSNGTSGTNCDVTLGWQAALQGSVFATAGACGISTYDGSTPWPQTLAGSGTVAGKTVTATLSSFSSTAAYSIWSSKQNQTITFNPLNAMTYGDADLTLNALSTNNTITITYASDNSAVATIVNGKIHIVGAGTANITASQAGNNLYNAATDVIQPLTVNKAALGIKANNATITLGDPLPAFTSVFTGLANGDVAASFTLAYTPATTPATASTYAIVPSATGAVTNNYNITYTNGVLTVNSPALGTATITFGAISAKTYGNANFSAGAISNNTETAILYQSSNTAVATIDATGTIHIVSVGSANITASQPASASFNAANNVMQTLVVNQAPLTITADNKTRNQGDVNPTLTVTCTGFVNGESVSILTTAPTITTTATQASAPGTYPITASGAAATNYIISYVDGLLTVNSFLQQVITFPALPIKTYGNADFASGITSNNTSIPIVYTSSNSAVATIAGGQIHIVGAGSTLITASQAGDATHGAAANQSQTLTVNKSNLIITANNQTKYAGDANPTLTVSYATFVNGENASVLTTQPVAITTATTASPAGAYPITVSGAVSGNYNISYVAGTLTVSALVAQTINFPALPAKTYGNADFATGATSNNTTVAVTYTSSNPSVATVVNGNVHITGAGTTTITASQAAAPGYIAAANVAQSFVVNKANLAIVADNKTKVEGQANPQLTASYIGFVNGDNASSLTSAPILNTVVTVASVIGNYPITVSGAASNNYNITYSNGVFSVTPTTGNNEAELKVFATSPSTLQVQLYVTTPVIVAVQLFDINGRVVYNRKEYAAQGNNTFTVPIGNVQPGIYTVYVAGNNVQLNKNISLVK